MKYLVASDIHGSYHYAEKIFELADKTGCDKVILLGDLLYHGPRNDLPDGFDPKKEVIILNENKDRIIAVKGNCDAEIDQMVLDFNISDDYKIIEDKDTRLFLTHGHHFGPDNIPPVGMGDVMLFGHFHVPCDYEKNGMRLINPGSVSIPKNGSCHSCIIYENGNVTWYDMDTLKEYDLSK